MKGSAVTIGTFDGLHIGHKALIKKLAAVSKKHKLKSIVVAFPYPVKQVCGVLTTQTEKLELLKHSGVDEIIILGNPEEIVRLSAAVFFDKFLHGRLNAKHLVVGRNFAFGRGREGDIRWLKQKGALKGIRVDAVDPLKKLGSSVSSSRIRELVVKGDVSSAARLLGRHYFLKGVHVSGKGVGRKLGFPTLNMKIDKRKLLPRGIFAGLVENGNTLLPAAVFIGERSTISGNRGVIPEAHLLDFKGEWKGKDIAFHLLKKIRDEKRFKNVQELILNISRDIMKVKEFFKNC